MGFLLVQTEEERIADSKQPSSSELFSSEIETSFTNQSDFIHLFIYLFIIFSEH